MTEQQKIKIILSDNDKTKTWLAEQLGMSKSRLGNILNTNKGLDVELHKSIIAIFKKHKFIASAEDKCNYIKDQTMEINSIFGSSLQLLNQTVKKITEDNVLDFKEKVSLLGMVDELRDNLNSELDKIKEMIEK